jgi:hypothetical protein
MDVVGRKIINDDDNNDGTLITAGSHILFYFIRVFYGGKKEDTDATPR